MKRYGTRIILPVMLMLALRLEVSASEGAGAWYGELDAVCSRTENSLSLDARELEELLRRCRALEPRIAALAETPRKVYGRRLKCAKTCSNSFSKSKAAGRTAPGEDLPEKKASAGEERGR